MLLQFVVGIVECDRAADAPVAAGVKHRSLLGTISAHAIQTVDRHVVAHIDEPLGTALHQFVWQMYCTICHGTHEERGETIRHTSRVARVKLVHARQSVVRKDELCTCEPIKNSTATQRTCRTRDMCRVLAMINVHCVVLYQALSTQWMLGTALHVHRTHHMTGGVGAYVSVTLHACARVRLVQINAA